MAFTLVRYKVKNYGKWKTTFNDAHDMRKSAGEKNYQVFKSADKPNEMVVIQEWNSMSDARSFAKSRNLRQCMEKAGVVGKPDIVFLKGITKTY